MTGVQTCALPILAEQCGSRLEGLSAQVAELAGSYAGSDTMVTFAAEYSLGDFEGEFQIGANFFH